MEESEGLIRKLFKAFSWQNALQDLLELSEHWNGHKREDAVRRLGVLGNPIAIPKLIVRVNDWVPQVRQAARVSLEKLLTNKNAEAFVYTLPDFYHLRECSRDNHDDLIDKIVSFLLAPENVIHIQAATTNDSKDIARIAVKLCIEHSLINQEKLVFECLSHSDIIIRSMASKLLDKFTGEALETLLKKAILNSFMPIRRKAFLIYLKTKPNSGLRISNDFLFDKHNSICEIAIKNLMNSGVNIEQVLTNILSSECLSTHKIRCAIYGLAYINSKKSLPIIQKLSENKLPSLRKSSIQALTKMCCDKSRSHLLKGLSDDSPNVAKESSRLLQKLKIHPSANDLIDIIQTTSYNHTIGVCISTCKKMNKWERLIFLLHSFRTLVPHDSGKADLHDGLTKWYDDFNRSGSQPSTIQTTRIHDEFNQCRNLLTEKIAKSLEFAIKFLEIQS